ncbi:redoxin domain-containing protein [candidate division KSB1 bacterium]|nr:redoxin domain-containing protein [candidate division KSB1 bacterium]NIR68350.1 redoxin domain-containing protein [candidate division KSB1 bacterium]NIS28290.1 redoxin domain-containing protein [candidate division KSB1 bacterium]NIT75162.1 redoxin domain-containing protein [candidate division KSB1 bacterium]NIU28966.1 redoxin domain-containing protein [candidate division KSB1 bacterium]
MPALHQPARNFKLPSLDGKQVELWDFRQRKNVVLIVLRRFSDEIMRRLILPISEAHKDFAQADAEILVVVSENDSSSESLAQLNAQVVIDHQNQPSNTYLNGADFGVFVIDRYGELLRSWQVNSATELPSTRKILHVIELNELACPECGISRWPVTGYEIGLGLSFPISVHPRVLSGSVTNLPVDARTFRQIIKIRELCRNGREDMPDGVALQTALRPTQ